MKKKFLNQLLGRMACVALSVALCVVLAACESSKKDEKPDGKSVAAVSNGAASPQAGAPQSAGQGSDAPAESDVAQTPPPSDEELDNADSLVAFSNAASMALASGRYAQADVLMAYTEFYLAEWKLAKRPSVNPAEDDALTRRLAPPPHLFTPDEEKKLAAHVQSMDKALSSMRADYRALERYVEDDAVQDDGVKGKQLAASIAKGHASYIAARNAYLGIVEAKVAPAKELLLRNHPLKRQIQAADNIFSVYRKAAELLASAKHDRETLKALRAELGESVETAGKPPFMAPPEVERPFREFLKQAVQYEQYFDRGLDEGFYNAVRQNLNQAALASRASYNDFVRAANQVR